MYGNESFGRGKLNPHRAAYFRTWNDSRWPLLVRLLESSWRVDILREPHTTPFLGLRRHKKSHHALIRRLPGQTFCVCPTPTP